MFNRVCLAGLAQTLLCWLPGRIVLPLAGAALLAFGGQLAWGQGAMVRPSSTPPMADTYPLGDDIEFEVDFQQTVTVTGTPVLKFLMGGAPPSPAVTERDAAYVSGSGTGVLRFSYEVQSRDLDLDGISMNADALVGGTITGTSTTPVVRSLTNLPPRWHDHRVDGVVPTVTGRTITSSSDGDNTYAEGDEVAVTLSFSEPVSATSPTLALMIGTKTASATLDQPGRPRNRLVFRYEVVAGDLDTDGLAIAAGGTSLAGGAITDIAGNPANRSFSALSAQSRHQVDAVAPTVSAVTIVSNAGADATYRLNERIEVAVQFSEPVRTGGSTALDIQIGNPPQLPLRTRRAAYHRRTGENTLVYRYTVGSGDMDADGISIASNAISGDVTDVPGNAASLSHDPIAEQADHRINGGADTRPPRATGVSFTGADENGWYELGDTITATVSFDEIVDVLTAVEGLPVLDLTIGSNIRAATWDDTTSGTRALRFTYVVQADDLDANGISVAAGAQSLLGAEIEDASGNIANRNFRAIGNQPSHKVDGVVPVVRPAPSGVTIAGSGRTYKKGDAIDVRVAFSETVNVVHNPRLQLAIEVGTEVRQADVLSGDGSPNLTFRYRVQDDDVDENGIVIAANALTDGTFQDAAGNEWNTTTFQGLPAPQAQHQVDGDEPEIATVVITSDAGDDDTYVQGDAIELEVTFDQPVTVQGNPELLLVFFDDSLRPGPRRRARLVRSTPTVLTFSYVVAAGDIDTNGISVGVDPLVGGTIRDAAGNLADRTFDGLSNRPEHEVDAVAPEPENVWISSTPRNGHTYGEGEAIEVSVTFDEEVSVTGSPTLGLSIGAYTRPAPYATGSGTRTLVFRYQVQVVDSDDDGISIGPNALQGGAVEDPQGTAIARRIQPLAPQPRHRVDGGFTPPPGVVDVRFTSNPRSANRYYTEGEVIELQVEFSSVVFVTEPREPDEDAELRLVLGIGEHSRFATYVEGSGTATLTFRYTVAEGDLDADGIAIGPGSVPTNPALVGGRIQNAVGTVVANRYFRGLPANPEHRVDAVPLVAVSTTVRNPPSDGSYGLGEFIEVAVRFDEPVFVDEANSQLQLVLGIGTRSPNAEFVDGGGTATLVFRYIVRQGDFDADGISIGPGALVGASIVDRAANEWMADGRRIPALGPLANYQVNAGQDGVVPRIESVRIVSEPADARTFRLDEPIAVHVVFTEAVFVTGEPTVALSIGATVRDAVFVSGSGTATLEFRYVVQEEDFDDDGVSIGPLALAGGVIVDAGGNAALRDSSPSLAQENALVEGGGDGAPAIGEVAVVTDPPTNGAYTIGDSIDVAITFNQVVHVTGEPTLDLSIGADTRQAAYHAGSGTMRLTFRYVVRAGDYDDDGISIGAGPMSLVGGTIQDGAGNDARRTFRALEREDSQLVGARAPQVDGVSIVPAGARTYVLGDSIDIEIVFTDAVHVTGQPTLAVAIGAATRQARLLDGSGTETLTFRYVVQASDEDDDGISIAAGPASLAGATIQDRFGNDAVRTFSALHADGHVVSGQPTAISRVAIASSPTHRAYRAGEEITVHVVFENTVHVTGRPTLALSVGAETRPAAYRAGSGTQQLAFHYTVQAGDYDEDGISIAAGPGSLVEGMIQDSAGNDVSRAFNALAHAPQHRVDARPPTIDSVTIASAPADRAYRAGEEVVMKIVFDDIVHVTGQPTLALSIGAATRQATFDTGSGTTELAFSYAVQAGDYDEDGISIAAGPGSLTGGTIQDGAGNDVSRAFNALAHAPQHRVDARPPTIDSVTIASTPAGRAYRAGEEVVMAIVFNNIVHVTGQPTLALSIGAATRQATFDTGSGTTELAFRYAVQVGDYDEDGISIAAGPGSLTGGTIQDGAGNNVVRAFNALATDPRQKVDARPPGVTAVSFFTSPAGGVYQPGDTVVVGVTFSEQVHVTGQPVLVLSIGAASRAAAFVAGSGSANATLRFSYVIQADDFDEDGISIGAGPGSLSGGTIQDRNGNDALRDFEAKAADSGQRVGIVSLPAQPVRTLIVGQAEVIDLSEVFGVPISFGCVDQCTDNANVATATVARSLMTIMPLAEGTATITIAGTYLQLTVEFPVVVQADPAEAAVLEHALTAVARGLLSGASNTLGKRLESIHRRAGASIGGRRIGTTPWPQEDQRWAQAATAGALGSHLAFGADSADWSARQGMALDRLLGGSSFEMSLIADRGTKWAVWGAGDLHAFEGKPESGSYDGDLTSAYLGVDVEGEGWIAGAAFSRNSAQADYDFTSELGAGSGTVETTLNVVHPYVQWSLGQRGRIWAMAGVGVGEATFVRDLDRSVQRPPASDVTLRMGSAGLRSELLQFGGFELALRGDAGIASLATADGPTALDGLAVTAQRVRVGVEAGYALDSAGGGTLKPFLDIGGRFDGGDGQTGFGVEVAAGVRYRSATVGFEAKARTLAMHAADDYAETGASAMLMITPQGGNGLRFSLAPRWGGSAAGQELFWNQEEVFRTDSARSGHRRDRDKWGMAARLGYDFGLRRAKGAVSPFVEYDLNQRDRQETRFGIGYVAERAKRLQFDVSGARVSSPHGTEQRWLLTVQGRL